MRFSKAIKGAGGGGYYLLRPALGVSKLTFIGLPLQSLPSRPAMAARASCPSISIKAKPLHWPEKISVTRLSERTVPNSENSVVISFSVVLGGKLPTNSFSIQVSFAVGGLKT